MHRINNQTNKRQQTEYTAADKKECSFAFLLKKRYRLTLTIVVLLLEISVSYAQTSEHSRQQKFQLSLTYWQGFSYGGKVQVREFEENGTIFNLKKDLGMHSWIAPSGQLSYQLTNRHRFDFSFTTHYFSGSKTLLQDAWYNGTHLQAGAKASINKSCYYRLELGWQYNLLRTDRTTIGIRPALVYDHINFWVDAPFYEDTPRKETYEKFYRQQLPLPNLGFLMDQKVGKTISLGSSISGTYLPHMRTWMQEGGNIYLQQQNIDAKLYITYHLRNTFFTAGYHFRYFSLLEESREDTNNIRLYGSGVAIVLTQAF
jgi:hypothetical protein